MTFRFVPALAAVIAALIVLFAGPTTGRATSGLSIPAPADTISPLQVSAWQFEGQGGTTAIWTRRGTSNVFDAVYREPSGNQVTTVEEMTIQGSRMSGRRLSSSDGALCNFTGTVQPDGRLMQGTGACPGINSGWWWKLAAQTVASSPTAVTSAGFGPLPTDFPTAWQFEGQGGTTAIWTRRGTSNVFDAVYREPSGKQVTTVEEMTIQGNQVSVRRISSSDGTLCNFTGTIQPNGRSIQGTGACPGINSGWWWKLTVSGAAGGGAAGPPTTPARSLTGAWVHSASSSTQMPDSKVIVVQDGAQVTLTQTYKADGTQGHWVTLVCAGPLSNGVIEMRCNWAPGGNPLGFAGDSRITMRVSADGNHLDGTLRSGPGNPETHYSRIP